MAWLPAGTSAGAPVETAGEEANAVTAQDAAPAAALATTDPAAPTSDPRASRPRRRLGRRTATALWSVVLAAGVALLGLSALDLGPSILDGLGAVVVTATYTWGLAARTGGRPVVFTALAIALGAAALAVDNDQLRSGAAVMTGAVSAVFAVMVTVPARRFPRVVREVVVSALIAAIGSGAALGWEPTVTVSRFQYAVLAFALVGLFLFVYRLGAGLHGLGRRGLVVVAIGAVMLAATLLYAEMIRRYGAQGLVDSLEDGVAWSRDHLGGYPRPIEALLGVPALAWGTHMRARRRQGWWVCAFGAAMTAPVACTLVNTDLGVLEHLVSLGYSLVVGLVIGFAIIRIDILLTGESDSRSTSAGRRAAREAEDASAVRPEPLRTQPLL